MTTSLLDIFNAGDDDWMMRPDLGCAMPTDTPTTLRRSEADRWFPQTRFYEYAKSNCDGCPEKNRCLQYALENDEEFGVWGGTTPAERRELMKGNAA